MYSVQFGFGCPNDFPQVSTQDGAPRRRNTCSLDAPTFTLSYPAVIREFRSKHHPRDTAMTPPQASKRTAAFFFISEAPKGDTTQILRAQNSVNWRSR